MLRIGVKNIMNIAFFLTPKNDVVYLKNYMTVRQALEKMEYHRYSAVPIIDDKGRYMGTLTEGDLLWYIKHNPNLTFKDTSRIPLMDVPRHVKNSPVTIESDMENLIDLASSQNFVPVIDDTKHFIGIIKRSDIINYFCKLEDNNKNKAS